MSPKNQWESGQSGNPAGYVRLSYRRLIEEIGAESTEGDEAQSRWGKTRKEALIRRLFHEIIVNKQVHLIPKLLEYIEPSARQVNIEITDWRTRLLQSGIPQAVLEDRYKQVLESNVKLIEGPAAGRPDSSDDSPGLAGREADGETAVGTDGETGPAPEVASVRDPVRGSEGRGEELRSPGDSPEQPSAESDSPPELRST